MYKIKQLFILIATMVFAMGITGITAFAKESSNVVYIDATKVSQSELDMMVSDAQNGIDKIVISWDEGSATLQPIDASETMPYFNEDDTYYLTTSEWKFIADDYPIFQNDLKVTNKKGNPGAINIKIVYPDYLDITTEYYYSLKSGYSTNFSLTTVATSELYLAASDVSGNYNIKAKCS